MLTSATPSTSTAPLSTAVTSANGLCNALLALLPSPAPRTDRSGAAHNANNAGNSQIKPKWIANALNGFGVLRFLRSSETYVPPM